MAPDIGNGGQPGAITPDDDWAQSRSSQALNRALRIAGPRPQQCEV